MHIYTSNVRTKDPDAFDITVKSGHKSFAPTWDMVNGYKSGKISESEYTELYINMMRESWHWKNADWKKLLSRKRVVLTCYCPAEDFCHRKILAKLLVKCGKYLKLNVQYKGEI